MQTKIKIAENHSSLADDRKHARRWQ